MMMMMTNWSYIGCTVLTLIKGINQSLGIRSRTEVGSDTVWKGPLQMYRNFRHLDIVAFVVLLEYEESQPVTVKCMETLVRELDRVDLFDLPGWGPRNPGLSLETIKESCAAVKDLCAPEISYVAL